MRRYFCDQQENLMNAASMSFFIRANLPQLFKSLRDCSKLVENCAYPSIRTSASGSHFCLFLCIFRLTAQGIDIKIGTHVYHTIPQAWLTIINTPLNYRRFLASEWSDASVHLQTNCWSDWAYIWSDYLLVTPQWIPAVSWAQTCRSASTHFRTSRSGDWSQTRWMHSW